MKLFTIGPEQPFLDALAADWLERAGGDGLAVAQGMILLPTRRAARSLAEAFLVQSGGRPMLLPRITAFGAIDEAPLALAGSLSLPAAVPEPLRLAHLTRLVMALNGQFGAPQTADRAWPLAVELASLMDEAERAEIDLATVLPGLAAENYARHWGITLQFLQIVTLAWPAWLADNRLMNPAARQVALLDAQSAAWANEPPGFPVLAAGSTGGIPAVARLLKVVARMPGGRVILPGLDLTLGEEAWDALEDCHPQAGLRRLLGRLDARRADVKAWDSPPVVPVERVSMLNRALLPAVALGEWRNSKKQEKGVPGVFRLTPADQQEEAMAIALILRDALETPNQRAALVTPDRDLAGRVAAELGRFGITADDSAGEPLIATPPAVFLRLLATAVDENLRPVPLLALLKHPFAAAGLATAAFRSAARRLEREGLRGPAPKPGIAGLRQFAKSDVAIAMIDALESCVAPLLALTDPTPAEALKALLAAAEALAATPDEPGAQRLWSGEDGQALAVLLGELLPALAVLPPPVALPGLLDAVLAGIAVRSRRALRGREGLEHPRVFIWGLLEARLQRADVMVLGGLAEGVWPATADPGPWMSRPMRADAGLPSPEEAVGQMAHDWLMTACAAPTVILSCSLRRDGAPAVPARWLQRLEAMLRGAGGELQHHPAASWARALDLPAGPIPRLEPPAPRPPLSVRPRKLQVTEIETWLRDPYAIYARHVLRLRALAPIEQPADAADYGSVVHEAVHAFLRDVGTGFPPDAEARLVAATDAALEARELRHSLAAWWRPRLRRIASWLAEAERGRRQDGALLKIAAEQAGSWTLLGEHAFVLSGRADRIEVRRNAGVAILDYKTGTVPSAANVEAGLAPQLPLEAAMVEAGAFGVDVTGPVRELTYWRLTGGPKAGEVITLFKDQADVQSSIRVARVKLGGLVATFDDATHPYLSQPHPKQAPRFSDYTQLARVAEWAALDDAE